MDNRKNIENKFDELWESDAIGNQPVQSQKIYQKVQKRINASKDGFANSKRGGFWWAIAAILLIGFGIGWWYLNNKRGVQKPPPVEELIIASTKMDKEKIFLSDQSKITLYDQAEIKYPKFFSSKERTIELLNGKAFFEIAKDDRKPFRILSRDVLVTVLGTSFEIDYKNSSTSIRVETGSVEVKNLLTKKNIHLIAGESAIYKPAEKVFKKMIDEPVLNKTKKSIENTILTIQFENVSLQKVVKRLEQQSGITIELEPTVNSSILFSKKYINQPLLSIVEDLSQLYQLEIQRINKKIKLKQKHN